MEKKKEKNIIMGGIPCDNLKATGGGGNYAKKKKDRKGEGGEG